MTSSDNPLRFVTDEHTCSYVPSETASLEYRVQLSMSEQEYGQFLRRGWRRHGVHFFRPACPHCVKCRSLRVDVDRFQATKSQRRCLKRNSEVETSLHRAAVSTEHIRLYNLWHQDMTARRGWSLQQTSPQDYVNAFLIGDWPFAHEIRYYENGRMVGVGLIDLLEDSISSVYFYHAPDWRPRGPGTFSILTEIEFARQTGRKHLYLGYAIHECPSMAYKFRFGPHELLEKYVSDDAIPAWSAHPDY